MDFSDNANDLIRQAFAYAGINESEYMVPEHLLYSFTMDRAFQEALADCEGDSERLREELESFVNEQIPKKKQDEIPISNGMKQVFDHSFMQAIGAGRKFVDPIHLLNGIMNLDNSYAVYYLAQETEEFAQLLASYQRAADRLSQVDGEAEDSDAPEGNMFDEPEDAAFEAGGKSAKGWKRYAVRLNDTVSAHNPLIGREEELERTIQVLCCLDKNNPLHIGEAGVGKTSITYGLTALIEAGRVPDSLKGANVFMLDIAGMVAGTQYRGDFEKRMKDVLEHIAKENNPIIFIDELHTIMGAGDSSGSLDAAGILKPWFENPAVRFIGSTTYEDYNRSISKNRTLIRRFQNIDIPEPSKEECVRILEGIRERYETHHNICYGENFLEQTVELSARYMNERFLPDKAIGLIDEAGAYLQIHPEEAAYKTQDGRPIADTKLLDLIVSKVCRIPANQVNSDEEEQLNTLKDRICSSVFGQDPAIESMVNSVLISRLGLIEEHKPVASMLFVGPTGVGKTEAAKVLARELGVSFLRYDMSEYTEKHTIAKLIGSPAGYVGFEDGGQLTDAIRKNPHCVLLLDEIEKAHGDIYNVLLQVMDYATLTDNHGRKADFSHVILIMTSNAGAAIVGKPLIGFGDRNVLESNMMDEVKKTFTPEFRNRLTKTVVFGQLSKEMAQKIVEKKLLEFAGFLVKRDIIVSYDPAVYDFVLTKGYSREYGAREIDRVITEMIKPVFVKGLLKKTIKDHSEVMVSVDDAGQVCVKNIS